MTWSAGWYSETLSQLLAIRGDGPTGRDGKAMPALLALDTVAIVASVTKPLISEMEAWNRVANADVKIDVGGKVVSAWTSTDLHDGQLRLQESMEGHSGLTGIGGIMYGPGIDAATYLKFFAIDDDKPWVRAVKTDSESIELLGTYEVFTLQGEDNQIPANQIGMANWRLVIAAYQRLANAAASAIANTAPFLDSPCDGPSIQEVIDALGVFAALLDNFNSVPPVTQWNDFLTDTAKVLKESLHTVEEVGGKAIADIAHEVGVAAGNVTKGFFEEASILSIAVVGLAVYIAVRR